MVMDAGKQTGRERVRDGGNKHTVSQERDASFSRTDRPPDLSGTCRPCRKFPAYSVLQATTYCLRLVLGRNGANHSAAPGPHVHPIVTEGASSLPRTPTMVPGLPLLDARSKVVGSLHPDNLEQLPAPYSPIDLVVLSRMSTPVAGSALLNPEHAHGYGPANGGPWALLWVLYVEWRDGIAERRGIGQIAEDVLGKQYVEPPGIELKMVLLG
jgi:hypothetical protein